MHWLTFIIACVLPIMAAHAASPSEEFNKILDKSDSASSPDESLDYALKALDIFPLNAYALTSVGYALGDMGFADPAAKYFRVAVATQFDDVDQWEQSVLTYVDSVLKQEKGPLDESFTTTLTHIPTPSPRRVSTEASPILPAPARAQLLYNLAYTALQRTTTPPAQRVLPSGALRHLPLAYQSPDALSPVVHVRDLLPYSLSYLLLSLRAQPIYTVPIKAAQVLRDMGSPRHAYALLTSGSKLDPKRPQAWLYMADLLNNVKQFDRALDLYQRGLTLGGDDAAVLTAMGDTASNMLQPARAAEYYRRAHRIRSSPETVVGVAHAYRDSCDIEGQRKIVPMLRKYVLPTLTESFPPSPSALQPYSALYLDIHPALHTRIARSWATATARTARLASAPTDHRLLSQEVATDPAVVAYCAAHARYSSSLHPHDVPAEGSREEALKTPTWGALAAAHPSTAPQDLMSVFYTHAYTPLNATVPPALAAALPEKLTVAYISRRFELYPGAQLVMRSFGHHDRSRFRVVCFANGKDDKSRERGIIKATCDEFHEVVDLPHVEVAALIRRVGAHVLIDFDGGHHYNNLQVLSLRPAPVQVTFLGFAGSLGADAATGGKFSVPAEVRERVVAAQRARIVDFIMGDHVLTPVNDTEALSLPVQGASWGEAGASTMAIDPAFPISPPPSISLPGTELAPSLFANGAAPAALSASLRLFMAEPAIVMPHSYQPQDWRQPVAPLPSRASQGLPEDAFVFAAFNRADKVTPELWDMWVDILRRAPRAVLWLLTPSSDVHTNLLQAMDATQLDRSRLVFAPRVSKEVHLSRHRLADVFLDTLHYGAHTTATDALYLGVPIITTPGRTFASRVCAGIMFAAGLEPLVAQSRNAYVDMAVGMATGSLTPMLRDAKVRLRALLVRHVPALWTHPDNTDRPATTAAVHDLPAEVASAPLPLVHTPLFHVSLFVAAMEQAIVNAYTRRVCAEALPEVTGLFNTSGNDANDNPEPLYMWQLPLVVSRRAAAEAYWRRMLEQGFRGDRVKFHKSDFENDYYSNPETIVNMFVGEEAASLRGRSLKDEL